MRFRFPIVIHQIQQLTRQTIGNPDHLQVGSHTKFVPHQMDEFLGKLDVRSVRSRIAGFTE